MSMYKTPADIPLDSHQYTAVTTEAGDILGLIEVQILELDGMVMAKIVDAPKSYPKIPAPVPVDNDMAQALWPSPEQATIEAEIKVAAILEAKAKAEEAAEAPTVAQRLQEVQSQRGALIAAWVASVALTATILAVVWDAIK